MMIKKKIVFLLLPLFILPAFSQEPVISFSNFGESGIVSKFPADIIDSKFTPNMQNVWTKDGIIEKMTGSQKYNAVTLGSNTVRALHEYDKVDGTKYFMSVVGTSVCYSLGDGDWTVLIATLNANYTPMFKNWLDKVYFSNGNDFCQEWDGATIRSATSCPRGRYLEVDGNRMWVAGVSGNRSVLYYSGLNNIDNFPVLNLDYIGQDDGDVITGLRMFRGNMYIFKNYSIYLKIGSDPKTFRLQRINNEVGCLYNTSIAEVNNKLYFFSHRGVVEFDGYSITIKSMSWDDVIKNCSQINPYSAFWLQSTATDFGAGTSINVDTMTVSGAIILSTYTWFETTNADFDSGTNSSTTVHDGGVYIDTTTDMGIIRVRTNVDYGDSDDVITHTVSNYNNRRQRFKMNSVLSSSVTKIAVYCKRVGSNENSQNIRLQAVSGANLGIVTVANSTFGTDYSWYEIDLSSNLVPGTEYYIRMDNNPSASTDIIYWGAVTNRYDNYIEAKTGGDIFYSQTDYDFLFKIIVNVSAYSSTATYTSNVSTITNDQSNLLWNETKINDTIPSYTTAYYWVRTSTSVDMTTNSGWCPIYNNKYSTGTARRFLQYKAYLYCLDDSLGRAWGVTPSLDNIYFSVRPSSGEFISQIKNTGIFWKSWGLFEKNDNIPAGTGINYFVKTATHLAGLTSAGWSKVTNGLVINSTTGVYIQWKSTFSTTIGTTTPRLDDVTINWYESDDIQPVSAIAFDNKYFIGFSTKPASNVNLVYVLQENNLWTKIVGWNPYCFGIYKQNLYFGDSTANGYVYWALPADVWTNDGNPIDAFYETSISHCGEPNKKKSFEKYYITAENTPCTLTTGYRLDYSTMSWTETTDNLRQENRLVNVKTNLELGTVGKYIQFRFRNNTANEYFRIRRLDCYYTLQPLE